MNFRKKIERAIENQRNDDKMGPETNELSSLSFDESRIRLDQLNQKIKALKIDHQFEEIRLEQVNDVIHVDNFTKTLGRGGFIPKLK